MKTKVVRIGNSRGIRIPKAILAQCSLSSPVELDGREGQLIVRCAVRPRAGWDEAFRRMHARGNDALLDRDSLRPTRWDGTTWQW